jgi:hypothetical protein
MYNFSLHFHQIYKKTYEKIILFISFYRSLFSIRI